MSLSMEEKAVLGHIEMVTGDDESEMVEMLARLQDHIENRGPEVPQ